MDRPRILYVASTSRVKLDGYTEFFSPHGIVVESTASEPTEIQSVEVSEVAAAKARSTAGSNPRRPLLVDDVGLEIPALDRFPGALLGPTLAAGGTALLAKLCAGHTDDGTIAARFVCAAVLVMADRTVTASGHVDGLLDFRRGTAPDTTNCARVFVPNGGNESFGELQRQHGFSAHRHRFMAAARLLEALDASTGGVPSKRPHG